MNKFIILIATIIVCASTQSIVDFVEDIHGQQYYSVRAGRHRRQAKTEVGVWGPGLEAGVKHSGTILDTDSHNLGGTISVGKQFIPDSPISAQGDLSYLHKDSGSGLSATVRQNQFGTDLGLEGKYNIYQNGRFGVDATGGYERHYGGPGGTSDPNWNTMLNAHYDF